MSHDGKLVYMANQIGKFFAAQASGAGGEAKAVEGVASHMRKFWDPSMRRALLQQIASGDAGGLDPLPAQAARKLAEEMAAKLV